MSGINPRQDAESPSPNGTVLSSEFIRQHDECRTFSEWTYFGRWARALEAYGTPLSFVTGIDYVQKTLAVDGREYLFLFVVSPNHALRDRFIAQERAHPYVLQQEDYGHDLDLPDCLLCQNIARGLDARQFSPDTNNIIAEMENGFVFPNRYPAVPGHSLYVPKTHGGTLCETVNAVSSLDSIIRLCDGERLIANQAHPNEDMSIPGHSHTHLFPERLPPFSSITEQIITEKEPIGEHFFRPCGSPFATLGIERKDDTFTAVIHSVLSRLEQAGEVFTLVYSRGCFLITPRQHMPHDAPRHKIGGGVGMHMFGGLPDSGFVERIRYFVPGRQEYDWERFIHP